jgi:uncharacterized coiled-coil protein SlyX
MLSLAVGLTACGVSTEVYTRTLHERDQFHERLGQAELDAAAQRQRVDELQAALTEQRKAVHDLQARVTELETLTADQNLAQVALAQQLRSATAEREELLLKLDEHTSQAAPSSSVAPASSSGATSPAGGAYDQQVTAALHEAIDAGDVTIRRVSGGLLLQLNESVLFTPGKEELTAQGQRVLSTVATAISAIRWRRLQVRIGLTGAAAEGASEEARGVRSVALNRGIAIVRQVDQRGSILSELVLLTNDRQGDSLSATSESQFSSLRAGEIQLLMTWPTEP